MPLRYITDTGTGNRTVNAGEKLGEAKQQAQNALTKGTGTGSGTQSRSATNSAPAAAARQSGSPAAASLSPYRDITGAAGNDALYKVRSDSAQQTAFDRLRSGIRSAPNGSGETSRTTPSGVADRIRSGIRSMAEENRASGVSAMRERFEQSAAQAKQSYSQTIEGREAELNSRAETLTRESDSLREMQKTAYYQEKQLETLRAQIELDPQESYINEYMSVLALHDKIADDYNRRALLQQANIDDYNDQSRLLEQAKQERYYTEEYGQWLYDEYEELNNTYIEMDRGHVVSQAKEAYEQWRSDMFTHAQSEALDALDENTLGYLNAIVDYNIETDSKRSSGLMMGGASGYVDYDSDVIAAKKQAVQALLDMGYTQEEIDSLAEYQQYRRNAEETANMISDMEEYMGQSWGNAAVANIASIVLSPMQGLGMMEFLNRRVNKYAPLDVNSANFAAVNMVQAVRNKTSEDISASFNSRALGNTLSFLYQTGMSVADSGLLIAAVGPASVYLMGTSAAAATAKDATNRGASVGQAFMMALASGAAEILTEKFSVENLLNNINSSGVVRAMLRQAGVEASEEMTSEIANIISDAVIMGDRSNWHAKISEYMAAGMSEEDAKTQAFLDSLIEVGLAGLGGALSGGVMAGVGSGANNIRTAVSVNSQIGTLLNSGYQTGEQYAGTMENAARWNADGRLFSQESEQQAQRMLEQMRGLAEGTYAKYAAEGDIRPLRTFAQQQAAELADSINETLAPYGITVRADTSGTLEGTDCMIDLASGEVLIGPEVTDQDVFDFKVRHELGHAAAKADPALVSETIELARKLGYDIDAIRQEKALSYFDGLEARGYSEAELTQLLTDEYLDEEIFGDLVWALDRDGALIDNMAQRAPNLLTRILDCLRNLIARLTGRVPETRLRNYQRIADNIRVTLGIEGDGRIFAENDGVDFDAAARYNELTNEGGVNNGREMGDYSIWRRSFSQNTGERITESRGSGRVSAQRSEKTGIRLYAGRGGQDIHFDDSEGRRLTEEQAQQLQGTAITDESGAPLAVYHFTPETEFETFAKGDIGFHFGTQEQAAQRRKDLKAESGRTFRAYLNIKNPYRVRLDLNTWQPSHIGLYLWSEGILTDAQWNEVKNLEGRGYDTPGAKRLREMLDEIGIDGFAYPNAVEDGGDSYIALRDEQIVRTELLPVKEKFSASDSEPTDNPRSMGDDRWMYEDGVRLPTAEDTRPFGISDEDVGAEMDAMRRERDGIMLPRADGNTNSDGIMLPRADEGYYDSMLGEAENSPDWMGRRPGVNRTNRTAPEETEAAFTAEDIDEYEQYTQEINRPVEPKAVYDADLETLPKKAQNYLERTERGMVNYLAKLLGVPKSASREFLMPVAQKAAQEYINTGDISTSTMQELFDEAYNRAVVIDNDYYEQYKEVRDRLRTTPVTISAADTADIADYDRWRRSQFNTLRIVNNGGTPVDTLYSEFSNSYPELFPEYITAPGDMLQRMSEVSRSIRKTETTLDSYYGEQAGDMRRELYNQFSEAMDKFSGEFNTVRRFYAEQEQKRLDAENFAARGNLSGDDVKTIKERWQDVKQLRREADKVNARNLLTDEDNRIVDMLLRGKMRLEDVPSDVNRRGITEVYHARQLYQAEMKEISDTNRAIKARYRADADRLLQDANSWKDKRWGLSYVRETMERNVRDITGGSAAGEALIEHYFTPVHHNEAERTRVKNDYRDRVRALGLSRKTEKGNAMSESAAVQFYGEATDYIAQLEQKAGADATREGKNLEEWRAALRDFREQNPNLDMEKIQRSVEEFRKIYDELFEQMNDVRIRNGYEPVDYRKGYFPHFTAEKADGVLEKFGEMMGLKIRMDVSELPTSINGLTHTFRPGIRWFGSAQQRTGFATDYDALEGFDRYIEGVTDVIYHTDDIQRLRALSSQMRYRTTDAGLREQIDEIQTREDLSEYDKELRIKEVYEKGRYTLSKFVNAVEEYTNLLANKRAKGDRDVENALNRKFYNVVKTFSSRVAANMVAVNPGSWLTNFIPLVQGKTQLSTGELLRAMYDTVRAYRTDDGFVNSSDFLTNRRGSDVLVQSTSERISSALSSPMEYIDRFTADTLVRARYAQNLKSDMSHDEAISEADSWASEIMADRSKGSMPIVFEQKNPLTKVFTQFQLEVNNQLSWMFKDLPRRSKERDKWAAYLAGMLIQYMLGAWVYNEFYEAIVGRRAALDPIDIANDFVGDLTGYQLPNTIDAVGDLFRGESIDFSTEKKSLAGAGGTLFGNVVQELPFAGGIFGGGRLPISSAIPNPQTVGTAVANLIQGENDTRYNLDQIADEAMKPVYYGALPFGGGQVKKVIQGIKSVLDGGVYSVNKNGEDILRYPVYNDSTWDVIGNTTKGVLFGPISTEGGQDWINSGIDSFSARETAVYQGLRELGVDGREAISLIEDISSAEDDGLKDQLRAGLGLGTFRTREEKQRQSLDDSAFPEEARAIAYYGLIAPDSEREKIDALAESGIDETTAVMAAYKLGSVTADFDDNGDEISGSKARNQFAALDGLETSDDVRLAVFYEMAANDTMKGNIDALRESGLDDELIYSAVNAFAGCTGERDESGRLVSGSLEAEKSTALDGLDAYDSEKLELYYQLLASETELDNIDDLRESGLDSGTIYQGIRAASDGTQNEKLNSIRDLKLPDEDAAALYFTLAATDSDMEKYNSWSSRYGMTAEEFYQYKQKSRFAGEDKAAYLDTLDFSTELKAAIYFDDIASDSTREESIKLLVEDISQAEYYTYLRDTSGYEKTYDSDGDVISGSVTAQQLEYIAQMDDLDDTQKTFMWLNGAADATQRTMYEQNVVGARAVGIDIYTLACYITELFASTSEEYGSSRKEKVMAYIDSLDLNSEQKDYLYMMEYAASGLKNTPWHTGVDFSRYLVGDYYYGR